MSRIPFVLRRLAERVSRGVMFRRRLPKDLLGIRMWVTPSASLRYWFPSLERVDPRLLDTVRAVVTPGMCVWDVGANVGLFTFAAAAKAGRSGSVVAFEPTPSLAAMVRRTAATLPAGAAPVHVVEAAICGSSGVQELVQSSRSSSLNRLSGSRSGNEQSRGSVTVETRTLDSMMDEGPWPDVVKLDVEGLEAAVLEGAGRVLREARPIILCETIPPQSIEVTSILTDNRYTILDGRKPFEPVEVPEASWATLAIPIPTR